VKVHALFPGLDAAILYDVLHDPEYRTVWDENMIEGFCIEKVDGNNDVGYYSAKVSFLFYYYSLFHSAVLHPKLLYKEMSFLEGKERR
jgi:hypothetical protein